MMSAMSSDDRYHLAEDGVSEAMRLEVSEAMTDLARQRLDSLKTRREATLNALAQRNLALRGLWGSERKYRAFRDSIAKEKQVLRCKLEPPDGPRRSPEERANLRRAYIDKIEQYLARQGIDSGAFKTINQRWVAEFGKLDLPDDKKGRQTLQLIKRDDLPEWFPPKPVNTWSIFKPPFSGWAWSCDYWYTDNFQANYWNRIDTNSGSLQNQAMLFNLFDQGDDDAAQIEHSTEVALWFRKKTAGPVEVWIEAEAGLVRHELVLWNAPGWSDSEVSQKNYLTFRIGSSMVKSRMSWLWEEGYTDAFWTESYLIQGQTYWAHMFSTQSFAVNDLICIFVGQKNWNNAASNDVEVHSVLDATWKIKSVQLR